MFDAHGASAPQPWRNLSRRSLTIALTVLPIVALINVGVLVWSLGGIDLAEKISRPDLLGLAACLVFVPMLSNSLRLAIWARFLGVDLGFARAFKVITGMMVANSVTPSATGGMPIKVLFLMGEGVPARRALTFVSFQTAEDALVLFSLVGLCAGLSGFALFEFLGSEPELWGRFSAGIKTTVLVAAMAAAGLALIVAMVVGGVFGRRVQNFVWRVVHTGREYLRHIVMDWGAALKRGKGVALVNITLAAVQWMVRFSIAGLVLAAFGIDWQPALFWLLQYLVQSISSIVPTPGGAGGAEAGFLFLFAPFVPVDVLVPAMSTWRLMFFYLPLTGAACLFFVLARKVRPRSVMPAAPPQPVVEQAQPAE